MMVVEVDLAIPDVWIGDEKSQNRKGQTETSALRRKGVTEWAL